MFGGSAFASERALAAEPAERFESAGALEAALAASLIGATRAPDDSTARPRGRLSVPAALAAVGIVGIAGAALTDLAGVRSQLATRLGGIGASQPSTAPATGLQLRQITMPPVMFTGRPSRDGRRLAVVDVEGNLALVDLATGDLRRLTNKGDSHEFGQSQMAISRDSRFVAYTWAALDGARELRVIGSDGRQPRVLLRQADIEFPGPVQWSSDDRRILAALEMQDGETALAMVDSETGSVEPIRRVPHPRAVSLSPDDRFVAFDTPADDADRATISIVRVADGVETDRIERPGQDTLPLWTPTGDLVFASDRAGSLGLWIVAVRDGRFAAEARSLYRDIGRYFPLGLTEDGALYFRLQSGMVDVYTGTTDFGSPTVVTSHEQVAPTSVGNNMSSGWSADGRLLAYVASRGLSYRVPKSLVVRDVASGAERRLHPLLADIFAPVWSPDHRHIAVRGFDLQGENGAYLIDVASGAASPVVRGLNVGSSLAWSPDGRALIYNKANVGLFSHDVATGREAPVLDYRTEGIVTLEHNPGAFRVSPDGQQLAFVAFPRDGEQTTMVLRVRPLAPGATSRELLRSSTESLALQPWSPDGREVLVTRRLRRPNGPPPELWRVPVDGSDPVPTGFSMPALRYLELSRDGTRLTFTAGAPLVETWVLEGFMTRSTRP